MCVSRRSSVRNGLLVGVAALALVLAGCGAAAPGPPAPSVGTRDDRALPADVRMLPLVDDHGRATSLAAFHGRIVVISDMMTLCQETCPLDTANVVATARAVTAAGLGDRIEFASITVDPERDTPARLAAYRALFDPPPADWTVLTGSPDTLNRLWRFLGVYHQKVPETGPAPKDWLTGGPLTYDVTHSDLVFFVDADGTDRFTLDGAGHVGAGDRLPAALGSFLNAEGRRNLVHPESGTWTVPQALDVLSWLAGQRIAG